MRRELIYVPIRHSPQDMGTLGQKLPGAEQASQTAEAYWARVEREVKGLALCWKKVKVYQDGLPDASPEAVQHILDEVQSPNYDLLRWLVAQGATVLGTENPDLLKQEYDHLRAVVEAPNERTRLRARDLYARRAAALLALRDSYIARRIGETLRPGEAGILFLGMAHKVAPRLARDIAVRSLAVKG